MTRDLLFKRLCDPSSIEIGWHLAHADSRDDFATDPLGYADFALMKKERFRFIVEQLRTHRYRIGRLTDIDIPKSGLSVRPGNVLPIEEATILHAIIYLIAPRLDAKLHTNVYSYRLASDWQKRARRAESLFSQSDIEKVPFLKRRTLARISINEPWYEAWPEFDAETMRAVKEKGYTHLTKTDISAYFENIELKLLDSILRKILPNDPTIIEILMRILEYWTRRTPSGTPIGRGIPQGNDVSSFLGNIFLMQLDEELEAFTRKRHAEWFRYVDDIKVFTKSYADARESVFLINRALRQLHLNLQGSKTEVLSGQKLENELFDPQLEVINSYIQRTRTKQKKTKRLAKMKIPKKGSLIASQFTRGLPDSIAQLSGRQNRLFRRCLTLWGIAGRPNLRRAAIDALRHLPDARMLRSALGYLRRLDKRYHEEVATTLLRILVGGELPFAYQVAATISTIKQIAPTSDKTLASSIRELGLSSNTDWYIKQKSLEAILALPYTERSVETLVRRSLCDDSPWVRRAAATLLVRGRVSWVRDQVKILVYNSDPELARIALYWSRHLDDIPTAESAIAGINTKDRNAETFMRRLPLTYLLRCHQAQAIGSRLLEYVEEFRRSKEPVVAWHAGRISAQLSSWVRT